MMASGITRDIGAAAQVVGAVADQQLVNERMRRLGLSPTQVELNRLYAYFRTAQHDACVIGWDGDPHLDAVSREGVASSQVLPAGYEDVGKNLSNLPLKYRRPSVPCHLCHVIVSRFTDLLFTEQQAPAWKAAGDPLTESWVQSVTKAAGLWATMMLARDMGGAMGTAIVGFKIIASKVLFESFDRRWCFPTWDPKKPGQLAKLEVRYMYPKEVRNPDTGTWEEKKFWYRRTVDHEADCLWKPQEVGDGSTEPNWENPETVEELVRHDYGFVPIEWIQNKPVTDDMDGDPDCLGCYDYFDRVGELDSQCHTGSARNADPTPVLASDGDFSQVKLGSQSAVKTEKGGSLAYAESTGSSIDIAAKQSDRFQGRRHRYRDQQANRQHVRQGVDAAPTVRKSRRRAADAEARDGRAQDGQGVSDWRGHRDGERPAHPGRHHREVRDRTAAEEVRRWQAGGRGAGDRAVCHARAGVATLLSGERRRYVAEGAGDVAGAARQDHHARHGRAARRERLQHRQS
jgi:hypothetical protein